VGCAVLVLLAGSDDERVSESGQQRERFLDGRRFLGRPGIDMDRIGQDRL
jgi:hypothetical protein